MQEKNTHEPLTNAASYHPKAPLPRNPTITDRGAFALISTEYVIFVADALTATAAAAGLIRVILRSWSHFRFRVARVPIWTSASRVHYVVLVLKDGRGARFPPLALLALDPARGCERGSSSGMKVLNITL